MRFILALGVLLLLACPAPAQAPAGPAIAFPQVTGIPVPLQSISGRFSSLNPLNPRRCSYRKISGRVVSPRLIMVEEMDCGRSGHDNALVNI